MADKLNRQQIYKSRLNDLWEIIENKNGYFWRRTAANNEIVGGSHISFKTKAECEANARLVGYEEQYNQPGDATWEFYQDGKKEYRWRLFDGDKKLNVCHEGYKAELSAQKNAVRHGWGQTPKATKKTKEVATPVMKDDEDCSCWMYVILLMILGLLLGWLLHTYSTPAPVALDLAAPAAPAAPVVENQIFTDVPNDAWHSEYVNKLANENLINGYRTLEGKDTGNCCKRF